MKLNIKILSPQRNIFVKTEASIISALDSMHIDGSVQLVDEKSSILSYGVIATPAIVINNEIKYVGPVPNATEIKNILSDYAPK